MFLGSWIRFGSVLLGHQERLLERGCPPRFGGAAYLITVHKLTAGDGYTYLTRQVAGGDVQWEAGLSAAEYYTAKGNPPGRWIGRGAPLLGLEGQLVTEAQMEALYGSGMHPNADVIV